MALPHAELSRRYPNHEYEGDPWDRQPDEPIKAYEAFQFYLDAKPDFRAINPAITKMREQRGLAVRERYSTTWAHRHRWRERAAAFDAYKEARIVARQRRLRLEAVERHARAAADAQEVALAPIQAFRTKFLSAVGPGGETFLESLDAVSLLKLSKMFMPELANLQRAERDARDPLADIPDTDPALLQQRGETVRRMLARPDVIALMEKVTVEVRTDPNSVPVQPD